MEELAERVAQQLWDLQLDKLKEVCVRAKIPGEMAATRRAVIKNNYEFY
jgi:hypothetical protein